MRDDFRLARHSETTFPSTSSNVAIRRYSQSFRFHSWTSVKYAFREEGFEELQ